MEGRGNQENPNQSRQASVSLLNSYSELSSEGKSVIEGLAKDVLSVVEIDARQISSNQSIYDVPRKENNASRNGTLPPLPLSPPPSTLSSESGHVGMNKNYGHRGSVSSETSYDLQQCSNNGSRRLNSGSISESEMSEAVDQAAEIVCSSEVQEQLENKTKNDPSFLKKMQEKWNSLGNKDKSLFGLGTFGIAVGAPIAIIALPILATVAAVAGLAIAIIGGLKLATPSKAQFKKTGQEMMHSAKNAANILPGETNLEKLWKSTHKPLVTSENPNLEEFLIKYCFPDQESGKKAEVKFDTNKIEVLKYAAKEVGLDIDIDRMVRKGESKVKGDFVQGKSSQAQGSEDNKFIATIDEIATAVMEKHRSHNPFAGIQAIFEDKLTEIKQTKATEKAAEKKNSFLSKFNKRSQSYTEGIEEEKNSNRGRSNRI